MAEKAKQWQEDELLLTLRLYCRTSFGKLHQHNPDIIQLANIIGRSPSAVAMKACNFASLDPALAQKGLQGASKADRDLWSAFRENSTDLAERAEELYETKVLPKESIAKSEKEIKIPQGETETLKTVKVRRVQQFFRSAVLESYNYRCAISGLAIPELLIASHIIPWAEDESRRADPANGILLNALYDKAFDRGLITFDDNLKLVLSKTIKENYTNSITEDYFTKFEGKSLEMPYRFMPDMNLIARHQLHIFKQ